MKILRIGTLVLLAASLQVCAQQSSPDKTDEGGGKGKEGNCGLLYGKDHSLTFCAPGGWTLDNGIMNDQGIYAAFYPDGSNWQEAKRSATIMYINVVSKPVDSTVAKMMEDDTNEAKSSAPGTVVRLGEPIKIGDQSTPVLRFAPGGISSL